MSQLINEIKEINEQWRFRITTCSLDTIGSERQFFSIFVDKSLL